VYQLDTSTGRLIQTGALAAPTHDAAATVVGNDVLVFGGGTNAPGAIAQDVTATGSSQVLGLLPVPRADGAAVTLGSTAFVVGGYNGPSLDPGVLATSNGVSFRKVATLPVPVRYPAVVVLDGLIYMFGGESAVGLPVSVVQVVNPQAGTAKVLGHLPLPLSGAAAGVLDGVAYIAGGLTGSSHEQPVNDVFAFDAAHGSFLRAGSLPIAVSNAGAAVSAGRMLLVGGETTGGVPNANVQVLKANRAFGVAGAPGAGSPFYGYKLLVADRGNDRLLLIDDTGNVIWTYPSPNAPPPPGGFYFPDDAFFIRHGTAIISNQEENDTVVEIAFPSGRLLFSYGHPRVPGAAPGYLNNPDDAYLLRNGNISVADPMNCRVIVLDPNTRTVLDQIGAPGNCTHDPPNALGSPNGDTPLADGNLLVSEINGSWVDEYTTTGSLVWDVQLAIGYPSDPQQIGTDLYLVADYENPGAIVEFNREGKILYRYQPATGPGELNHPSLVELLASGVFLLNDDYNHRMVAIDPRTGAVVWQYGETGTPGTAPGLLNTPDGFDILGPGGSTPTHTATG
jgi:outer membrane protein assembly factor BamB